MPPPPRAGGYPVDQHVIPHWGGVGWLRPDNRCLVPVNGGMEWNFNFERADFSLDGKMYSATLPCIH
jgi:hypothetical protein